MVAHFCWCCCMCVDSSAAERLVSVEEKVVVAEERPPPTPPGPHGMLKSAFVHCSLGHVLVSACHLPVQFLGTMTDCSIYR